MANGKDMPMGGIGGKDLPVRKPDLGYGVTQQDVDCGFRDCSERYDTGDMMPSPYPEPKGFLRRGPGSYFDRN